MAHETVNASQLSKCTQPYLSLGVQMHSPVSWSACGQYLAYAASDHSVVVVHVAVCVPPALLLGPQSEEMQLPLMTTNKSANWTTTIHCILHGHTAPVRCLLFSPTAAGGGVLLSAGADGIRGWNTVSADCIMHLPIAMDASSAVAAPVHAGSGEQGSEGGAARAAATLAARAIKLHEHDVECLEWIVPGKLLASGSKDSTIKMWDLSRLASGHAVQGQEGGDPMLPAGRLFGGSHAGAQPNGAVLVETIDAHKAGLTSIARHPSLPQFSSTARDGAVKVWRCGHLHARFETRQSYFSGPAAQHPTNTDAEAAGEASTPAERRDVRCELHCSLEGHRGDVMTASWTQDGTKLLSGGRDNAILVWDVAREALMGELRDDTAGLAGGHRGDVRAVVPFCGQYLRNAGELLQQQAEAKGAPADDIKPDFAPDLHAISVSGDGSLILWRLPEAPFTPQSDRDLLAQGRDAARLAEEEEVQRILADILSGTELDPNAKTDSSAQRAAESLARSAGESEYVPLPGVRVLQHMVPPCDAPPSALTASGLLGSDATKALSLPQSEGGAASGLTASSQSGSSEASANYGLASLAVCPGGHAAALTTTGGTLFIISLLPPPPAVLPSMDSAAASQRWAYAMAHQHWVARATCHRDMVAGMQLLHEQESDGSGGSSGNALLLSGSADGCVVLTDTGSNTVVCDTSIGTRITCMAVSQLQLRSMPLLFPRQPAAGVRLLLVGTADYSVRLLLLASHSAVELPTEDSEHDGTSGTGKHSMPAGGQLLEIGALLGHEGQLTAVQVSPCGRVAITASADLTVRVWDLRSALHVLQGGVDAKTAAKRGASKLSLASSSNSSLPALLLSAKHCLRAHTGSVRALSVQPVGVASELCLVTAGDDHRVKLWNLSVPEGDGSSLPSPKLQWESGASSSLHMAAPALPELGGVSAAPHNGAVQCAVMAGHGSPLQGLLFTGGWDKLVGVWVVDRMAAAPQALAAATGRAALSQSGTEMPLMMLSGHTGRITAVQPSSVDYTLLSADSDGLVILWGLSDGQRFAPQRRYHTSPSPHLASVFGVSCLLIPQTSCDFFFTGSAGGSMQAWPLRAPLDLPSGHDSPSSPESKADTESNVDHQYAQANREALLVMARRSSASVPGGRSGKGKHHRKTGLNMMGPVRAGSLRSLQVAEMEESASSVGKGVLPSLGTASQGASSRSVLHGSRGTGGAHGPVLGQVGRTPSSFQFAVQDGAKASLRRGSDSPTRRASVQGRRADTVVNNPLLGRTPSTSHQGGVVCGALSAREHITSKRTGTGASSAQGAADLKAAVASSTSRGVALPGGMQVKESPLHALAAANGAEASTAAAGGSTGSDAAPLPELQVSAGQPAAEDSRGAAGDGDSPATSPTGGASAGAASQGFGPTRSRKEQGAHTGASESEDGQAMADTAARVM